MSYQFDTVYMVGDARPFASIARQLVGDERGYEVLMKSVTPGMTIRQMLGTLANAIERGIELLMDEESIRAFNIPEVYIQNPIQVGDRTLYSVVCGPQYNTKTTVKLVVFIRDVNEKPPMFWVNPVSTSGTSLPLETRDSEVEFVRNLYAWLDAKSLRPAEGEQFSEVPKVITPSKLPETPNDASTSGEQVLVQSTEPAADQSSEPVSELVVEQLDDQAVPATSVTPTAAPAAPTTIEGSADDIMTTTSLFNNITIIGVLGFVLLHSAISFNTDAVFFFIGFAGLVGILYKLDIKVTNNWAFILLVYALTFMSFYTIVGDGVSIGLTVGLAVVTFISLIINNKTNKYYDAPWNTMGIVAYTIVYMCIIYYSGMKTSVEYVSSGNTVFTKDDRGGDNTSVIKPFVGVKPVVLMKPADN